jgi:hypothetical protein
MCFLEGYSCIILARAYILRAAKNPALRSFVASRYEGIGLLQGDNPEMR